MIEGDINERMARFAPSQNPRAYQFTRDQLQSGEAFETLRQDPQYRESFQRWEEEQRRSDVPVGIPLDTITIDTDVATEQDTDELARSLVAYQKSRQQPMPVPQMPAAREDEPVDPLAARIVEQQKQAFNATVLGARSVNPDEAAKALRLGTEIGIGQQAAFSDMSRAEQQAYLMRLRQKDYTRTDPVLANFLSNRRFAEMAHDDLGVLGTLHGIAVDFAYLYNEGVTPSMRRGFRVGELQVEMGRAQDIAGVQAQWAPRSRLASEIAKELKELGPPEGILGTTAYVIGQQMAGLPEVLETTVVGATLGGGAGLVGGPLAPATVPSGIMLGGGAGLRTGMARVSFMASAGLSYQNMIEKGYDPDTAYRAAIGIGLMNASLDMVSLEMVGSGVRKLGVNVFQQQAAKALARPGAVQAFKTFGTEYLKVVGTEGATEFTQGFLEQVIDDFARVHSGMGSVIMDDGGIQQLLAQSWEEGMMGVMGSSILGGIAPGGNLYFDMRRAAESYRAQNVFTALETARTESRLAARSPDVYERHLDAQMSGVGMGTLYIDGQVARQILAQSGLTAQQLEQAIPGIAAQIEEVAADKRMDVEIPTARYGTVLTNTDLGRAMKPHLRGKADGMSFAEAEQFNASKQELVREAEQILAQKQETDATFVAEARTVADWVRSQALAAGRTQDEADVAASMYEAFVVTQAAEQNMTPAQFQAQQGVRGIEEVIGGMPAPAAPAIPEFVAPPKPEGMDQKFYDDLIQRAIREVGGSPTIEVTRGVQVEGATVGIPRATEANLRAAGNDAAADVYIAAAQQAADRNVAAFQARRAAAAAAPGVMEQAATMDADYMSAVERGDMDTAQRMVDEAAKAAGYTIPVYHFTDKTFTAFDIQRGKAGPGIWLTSSRDGWLGANRLNLYLNPGKIENVKSQFDPTWRDGELSIEGILEGDLETMSAQNINTLRNAGDYSSTLYVATRPEQVKSADPVTYDEAGNIVPLSRRFDITSPRMFEQAAVEEAAQIDAQAEAVSDDDVVTAESQPEIPQSIDDAISLESVARLATGRTWDRGRDLKVAMQDEANRLAQQAGVNLSLDTPQTVDYLTRIGVRDALYALRQNPNSVGWYDEKTRQAIAVMALVHPELLKDENARFAFTWALAVTSNGIEVGKNFELANKVYAQYKRDGKMPTDLTAGQAQAAINRSLGMFNELVDAWGIDNLRKFAQTEYTIQELRYLVQDFDAGGEFANTVVKGAGILGPKIGNGFFSNLYGDFRSLTMDRWLIRTWGRWTGTLIKAMPVQTERARVRLAEAVQGMSQAQRTDLGAVLREYAGAAPEMMDAFEAGETVDLGMLAALVQKASMDVEGRALMNATEIGQEFRKAGNSLAKYLDGQKEAPSGPKERVQIRGIFGQILRELQQLPEYADLTMADLQAALWYAEKRLYETAREDIQVDEESIEGYADDEAPDYANAAAQVARASGVSEKRIASTLKKESNDERSRRARSEDAAGQPVVARDTGAVRGFTASEKRRFNGATVIRSERANRGAAAGSPRAYERRGRAATAKPRLVKKIGAKVIAEYGPARRLRNALKVVGDSEKQFGTPNFFELEQSAKSAEVFHARIMQSKAQSDFGASVFAYPVSDYEAMRLFLAEDGKSGFALKGDDIVSVFSMADQSMLHALMEMAVSAGGRRLDAFDTVLPHFYAPHGFRAVSRLRWDDSQAPTGWDKAKFGKFNNGEPDVVFMVYDPAYFGQYSTKDANVARSYPAAVRAQDAEIRQLANAGIYQQAAAAPGPRGGIDIRRLVIMLTKASDRTTLWHEFVHFFLHMYTEAAVNGRASERQRNDLDMLLKWFKIDGETPAERLGNWSAMTLDQKRKHHEALTYNSEIYAFEGKAPSAELIPVFERLRSFMLRVYKTIRDDLNAIYRREFGEDLPILTDEVRGVMDRMLATDEQIRRQAAINEMKPAFSTQEQAKMNDAEWAAYKAMEQEAIEASITDLNKASLRQMQWLGNARSRILRDMQRKHDAKRKEVSAEVAAAVRVEPVYRAMTYLRTGKFIDADGTEVAVEGPHRLDIKRVKEIYENVPTAESLGPVRATGMAVPTTVQPDLNRLGTGAYGMMGTDGLDPDMVAETFGYSSGDELIRALVAARPVKAEVAARTDAEMLRLYGDMNTPEAQEAEVQKALHNEARARMLAVELRWRTKATQPVRVMLEAAKQVARELIAGKRVRDVRPSDFVAAEARASRDIQRIQNIPDPVAIGQAAQTRALNQRLADGMDNATAMAEAIVEGARAAAIAAERNAALKAQYGADPQQALIRASRAQLYQNQLAAEALRVQEEVAKDVKYLRRVLRDENVKRMGAPAADQIAALLERYEVAPVSLKRLDKRIELSQWLAEQAALGIVPDIDPQIASDARKVNYREMKVGDFRDLVDAIKQIEYVGKRERKTAQEKLKADFKVAKDEIVQSIKDNAAKHGRKARKELGDEDRKWPQLIAAYDAMQQTIGSITYVLDGGERDGPVSRFLVFTANAAGNQETSDRAAATLAIANILNPIYRKGQFGGRKLYFEQIGESLSLEQRMVIALNYGNQSNIDRLLGGEGWTEAQVQPILESLTEEQLLAVQAIWDYMQSFRPRVAAMERNLLGREPTWLDPRPFTVRSADGKIVNLAGGYYPAKYNPRRSAMRRDSNESVEAERQMREAITAATTTRSYTKNRSDKPPTGGVLSRQMTGLYAGVNEVIHDLAWRTWAMDANRLLGDGDFQNAIKSIYGDETYKAIKNWVDATVQGERGNYDVAENIAVAVRQNVSISAMGLKFVTAAIQVTGLVSATARTGRTPLARAVAYVAAHPLESSRIAREKSSFMRNRGRTRYRDLNEIANIVRNESRARRSYLANAYALIGFMQGFVDLAVWSAEYSKAIKAGKSDDAAVAVADQTVIDTQGSGMLKDLSQIMRGGQKQSAYAKLFTSFYQYSNTMYALLSAQLRTAPSKGKAAADLFAILVAGAFIEEILRTLIRPSQDEEDLEDLAKNLIANQVDFAIGLPFGGGELRGIGDILVGEQAMRYRGPSGLRMVGEIGTLAAQTRQGEFDRAWLRSAINMSGLLWGIPSAQINDTIDGINAVVEGEVEGAEAVLAPITGVRR